MSNMPPSETLTLDKAQVRKSFNRAAQSYDGAAVLQQEVEQRLADKLEYINITPDRVLDLGCGTGIASRALSTRYKKSTIVSLDIAEAMLAVARGRKTWLRKHKFICADMERLPLKEGVFDLVFSSSALQWSNDLDQTFSEINRSMKTGGLILFATFGPDTLTEMRQAWRAVDGKSHVNQFVDMHDIGDALMRNGFSDPVMESEHMKLTYSTVNNLLRDLKEIGANSVDSGRSRQMTGKTRFKLFQQEYEQFRAEGVLPATYEIVYGHAWKGADIKRPESLLGDIPITINR